MGWSGAYHPGLFSVGGWPQRQGKGDRRCKAEGEAGKFSCREKKKKLKGLCERASIRFKSIDLQSHRIQNGDDGASLRKAERKTNLLHMYTVVLFHSCHNSGSVEMPQFTMRVLIVVENRFTLGIVTGTERGSV